ncbi:MAG: Fic family protein [Campylobacterota bacterium]|nr:Fic family protein [Campylobacterota bacterium]
MAKNFIEKVPFQFKHGLYDIFSGEYAKYYFDYKEVDDKGRYLYWEDFKWRVKKNDDPLIAWYAVKSARTNARKLLRLKDKNHHFFHYSVPEILQAKLYQIMEFSRVGLIPSDSIGNAYLLSSLTIEEAINSSQLEGASTTRRVAKEMLKTNRKPQTEDEQMIYNNYLLMKELQVEKDEDLSIDIILRFHKIATMNTSHNDVVPGKFRIDDEIYIADRDNNILFQPPIHEEIIDRMNALCVFSNSKHEGTDFIHPVIKSIILHFMIGYIHPFSDGNGRTARALFYWFMLKNGYDYFEYISISKLLKKAPAKYSKAYQYVDADDNDLNYFIFHQIDVILRAIDELHKYLETQSYEYEEVNVILHQSHLKKKLNFIQKNIIKTAMKNPGKIFKANEVAVDYDVAINTARTYLTKLVTYKILSPYKDGRTKAYIAPANLHDMLKAK